MLERVVGPVFGHIANTFIDAFVRRAEVRPRARRRESDRRLGDAERTGRRAAGAAGWRDDRRGRLPIGARRCVRPRSRPTGLRRTRQTPRRHGASQPTAIASRSRDRSSPIQRKRGVGGRGRRRCRAPNPSKSVGFDRNEGLPDRGAIDDNAARASPSAHSPIVAAALGIALACASLPAVADETPARSLADSATAAVRVAASSAWDAARTLTSAALDLIGIRYKWGGTTPDTGLDCSGLVQFVFQQTTGVTLPRSAKEMSRLGDKVALADLQPGDLVFFNTRRPAG